jgi:hypothetical protein
VYDMLETLRYHSHSSKCECGMKETGVWRCVLRMEGEQGADPAVRCRLVLGPATHPANSTARLLRGHAASEQHNSNHNGGGRQDVDDAHSVQGECCIAFGRVEAN